MFARILLIFVLFITLCGCGKPPILNKMKSLSEATLQSAQKTEITFKTKWIIPPTLEDLSSVDLLFSKELANYTLQAEIYMPEHGHGSSPILIEQDSNDPTIYHLSELSFFMTGHWELIIKLIQNNQEIEQWKQDIYL